MKLQKLAGLISINIIAKNGNKPLPKTATPYKNKTIIKKDNKPFPKKVIATIYATGAEKATLAELPALQDDALNGKSAPNPPPKKNRK